MTILELLESQAVVDPNAPTFPYNTPARIDGLGLLCELARKCENGTLAEIQVARAALEASAD